jgi:hypothetical protein
MRRATGFGWQRTAAAGPKCVGFRGCQLVRTTGNWRSSYAKCRSHGNRDAYRSAQ